MLKAGINMHTAVTICLVPEAREGPFVLHASELDGGLEAACRIAAELGFDAVEVFPGGAAEFPGAALRRLLADHNLRLAAVGTGAGWVRHGLHLCHADPDVRRRAREFIAALVDMAGDCGAPVIIGSMQGRFAGDMTRTAALDHLAAALAMLGEQAAGHGQTVLYEPLNRYETNLLNRQAAAADFIRGRSLGGVRLLCDLFHMNIEEADPAAAVGACAGLVGHVHWADSNRWALGFGHTVPEPIVDALRRIGYQGCLAAEVFPLPTPMDAARQSLASARAAISLCAINPCISPCISP